MRLFIALDLPDSARQMLAALQERLKEMQVGGRMVPVENLHMTLRFFENVADEDVDEIAHVVERVANTSTTPMLTVDGIGGFVRAGGDTIYARIGGGVAHLEELYRMLNMALLDKGYHGESRPFTPHITLMRGTDYRQANHLSVKSEMFFATNLTLYRSVLHTSPPTYDPLVSVVLPR